MIIGAAKNDFELEGYTSEERELGNGSKLDTDNCTLKELKAFYRGNLVITFCKITGFNYNFCENLPPAWWCGTVQKKRPTTYHCYLSSQDFKTDGDCTTQGFCVQGPYSLLRDFIYSDCFKPYFKDGKLLVDDLKKNLRTIFENCEFEKAFEKQYIRKLDFLLRY